MIYTSYYGGEQIGISICISITQKHGYNFQDLPLFKPSDALFKFWKNSKKDVEAERHYTDVFMANLASEYNDKAVDVWLHKVAKSGNDITLNCHEIKGFCHRRLVGEIIKSKKPELWGGEVESTKAQEVPTQLSLLPAPPQRVNTITNQQNLIGTHSSECLGIPTNQQNLIGMHEMGYTKPRYTWADQGALAKWWNPHGEEIAFIRHLQTREEKHGIYRAEDIPDGWGAVLAYGGLSIPASELVLVFDPAASKEKAA